MINSVIGQYSIITLNYWAFTLSDGALRMLVVLYFYQLGYSPLNIALLFILYELFGVITNLVGGWLGAKCGLHLTMHIGLALQIIALCMLLVDPSLLTAFYVMATQALSGIAKDLNKMSAKSSIKGLIKPEQQQTLYRWVAVLTGSKNTLKGVGFFLGGLLLSIVGFQGAISIMAIILAIILMTSLLLLNKNNGSITYQPAFSDVFSKNSAINYLSAARFFLFGSRDIWFTVALPVFLAAQLEWSHTSIGSLLACWIILYGIVQTLAPNITQQASSHHTSTSLVLWGSLLLVITIALAALAYTDIWYTNHIFLIASLLIVGLFVFAIAFAINSSLHSYLIVAFARQDGASLDIGFYYMANAAGRLVGILLSGLIYQQYGLAMCLLISSGFILFSIVLSNAIPPYSQNTPSQQTGK